MGSSSTPARHIHLKENKYRSDCEDARPSAQPEASQQQLLLALVEVMLRSPGQAQGGRQKKEKEKSTQAKGRVH
eukprot:579876-Pelagomonas_calceolata.AAC.1